MEKTCFSVPSLITVLEENKFSIAEKDLMVIKKIDDLKLALFQELYDEEKIVGIKKCQPPLNINGIFMVLYKVFYARTKYFKIFFRFSSKGEFMGLSMNDINAITPSYYVENNLKNLLKIEIENGNFGIEIENDYMKFLPLFRANNSNCIDFKNVTCNVKYDPIGIDFEIKFKEGLMSMQLKGVRDISNQQRVADKHFSVYPDIPLMFTFIGEKYFARKERLLELKNQFFAGIHPCVSFLKT